MNTLHIEQFLTKSDGDHKSFLEVKVLQNDLADLKCKYSNLKDLLVRGTAQREQLQREFEELKATLAADKLATTREFEKLKVTLAADKLAAQRDFEELKATSAAAQHESEKQKSIIRAFDLIRMYRHYYAEKIVGGKWGDFCEKFYEFEDDVFNGTKTQAEFDAFLKPFDDQLVNGLTFAQIVKLSGEGHATEHSHIRSAANQRAFLDECSKVDFVDDQSNRIASWILPQLKAVSQLRRMN